MSGSIFQAATEVSVGERDGSIQVTFRRSGDLSQPANVIYDVSTESATAGVDFTGSSGTVQFEAGQDNASVNFGIINDNLSEATETFIVSLTAVDDGVIGIPRTVRVNILDDENPVLPPVDPPLVSPYDVSTENVITGLRQPINFEFSPTDPNIVYIAEKGGLIRTYNIATGADLGVFIDLRNQVNEYQDRGLMDIALHPNFPSQPYLYAFYVVEPAGLTPDTPGNRFSQVVRFTADSSAGYLRVVPNSGVVIAGQTGRTAADISGGGTQDFTNPSFVNATSSEQYLRPNDPNPPLVIGGFKQNYMRVDSASHAGGGLVFGPDGMLYISTGDGASFDYADPRATHVQDLNSMAGKILRVDPMTGKGLTDNPYYQSGQSLDSNISKVYQSGLRNPFSITFDPQGRLFISETGWSTYEEINHGVAGANFGWPYYEGGEGGVSKKTSGFQNATGAAEFYAAVENGTKTVTAPYGAFGHAAAVPGYQNQAITGGNVVYSGNKYPAALQGDYFFSNFPAGQAFTIDTNDRQQVNFLFKNTSPYAPVFYKQGPDGYVYFADLGNLDLGLSDGRIGRILISDPQASNLLVNGSFEATTIPNGSSNYASIPGWTALTGGRIELWKNLRGMTATNGTNFAELDFDTGWDGFYQDVQTVAGQAHTLTFDLRRRSDIANTTPGIQILWNGQVMATTAPGTTGWGSFTVSNLVGTGGLDRLTIRELQSESVDGVGAVIDNFRLVAAGAVVPSVSVSANPSTVAEAAGANAGVTFTLNAVQSSNVTVTYSTVNGTAVAGSDFTGATNATATILAGQTSATVQIPILNDNVAESSESFSVNLVGATLNGNAIQASGSAAITITDNDPPPTGTNLLVNGSFEATTIPNGSSNYASIPGWTALTGGRIELWKNLRGMTASNGVNFAELDFDTALDGFYQDVQTVAGQSHSLTFDLRRRTDYTDTTPGIEVLWNGQVVATTTPDSTNWGSFTVSNLIGTGGLDRLTIRELQSESVDGRGAVIDNFRLVAASAAPLAAQSTIAGKMAVSAAEPVLEAYDFSSFLPGVLAPVDTIGAGGTEAIGGYGHLFEPKLGASPRRSRASAWSEVISPVGDAALDSGKTAFGTKWRDLLLGTEGKSQRVFGKSDLY